MAAEHDVLGRLGAGRSRRTDSRRCARRSSCARGRADSRLCRPARCSPRDSDQVGAGERVPVADADRAPRGLRRFRSRSALRRFRRADRVASGKAPKSASSIGDGNVCTRHEPALLVELAVVRVCGLRHGAEHASARCNECAVQQPAVGQQPRRTDDEHRLGTRRGADERRERGARGVEQRPREEQVFAL